MKKNQEPRKQTFNELNGVTDKMIWSLATLFKVKSVDEVEEFHGKKKVEKPSQAVEVFNSQNQEH